MKWCSREDLHLDPPLSQGGMQSLITPREHLKVKLLRHAGYAPAPSVWKTDVLAITPMARKKWLPTVSRRPLPGFSGALIFLSYAAKLLFVIVIVFVVVIERLGSQRSDYDLGLRLRGEKMVLPQSYAPRSIGYRPIALLLSDGGKFCRPRTRP